MKKLKYIYLLLFLFVLTACPDSYPHEWFCSEDGYYQYKAHIIMNVTPNQPMYHVGDTITVSYHWPSVFLDSLSGVSFSFNDQEAANPRLSVYYMDTDSIYTTYGIDTMYDVTVIEGEISKFYFGFYPKYHIRFAQVGSGMVLSYNVVFHTPGRFLNAIYMFPYSLEDLALPMGNCAGEVAEFKFSNQGPDYYSTLLPPPNPWELTNVYSCYDCFRGAGGFMFNITP